MSDLEWQDDAWTPEQDAGEQTEQATAVAELLERLWRVILYNDDWHTFDEVIEQLQKATGCSADTAARLAYEVHTRGLATVYEGQKDRCKRVAAILREIRLQVEIDEG